MTTEMLETATGHEHRQLMTYFPTGVTVITAIDDDGEPTGLTCSSLTSICLEPPTVMVSLRTISRTTRHALARARFGATLLEAGAQEIAQRFATPALDRFAGLAWTRSPLGVPWIMEWMTAAADFELWKSMEVGDHTLLFGLVRNVRIRGGTPLLYGLRRYQGWQSAV
jgi:flavin reductase (DIM6/NTAB) family NADH-FMN oxidoreductase RutF